MPRSSGAAVIECRWHQQWASKSKDMKKKKKKKKKGKKRVGRLWKMTRTIHKGIPNFDCPSPDWPDASTTVAHFRPTADQRRTLYISLSLGLIGNLPTARHPHILGHICDANNLGIVDTAHFVRPSLIY